ncbi:MAG: tRNA (N6-threonylcarbamoyladenosine(37)-N6)-methyltransferase TrmO [Anaerolineaceae bacterium]|nr:tRNA (N6-threonylcarbamoyladenosine(37)-N6)-methyltransferase TrmO [Anaerolineaceae bacterium]
MNGPSDCSFEYIGQIHTPYTDKVPYQPVEDDAQSFWIELNPQYQAGLDQLATFKYIYVIFHIHSLTHPPSMTVKPPWADGVEVGVFASRSPNRPNPIGLSVVRIKKIEGCVITVSGLDVFDGTPLLDIKPYIKDLDNKPDANLGWVDRAKADHLKLHADGIPHQH